METKSRSNSKKTIYDVAIIGCGTAGIFAGYELAERMPSLKVVMIEQGSDIYKRKCPSIKNRDVDCIKCKGCSIMNGFGGAGAFSDGKFNFTTEFGGWLNEYMSNAQCMQLFEYVDSINVKFGASNERFSTRSKEASIIEKKALENDLHLLHAEVKHLGTENNLNILKKMYEYMRDKAEIRCNTQVTQIIPEDDMAEAC